MDFHIERNYTFTNETKMNMSDKNKRTSDNKEISHSLGNDFKIFRNSTKFSIPLYPSYSHRAVVAFCTDVILGDKVINLYGPGYIEDYIGDVKFRISPLSFFQVNWSLCLKSAKISQSAIFHCLSIFITMCLAVYAAFHPISSFI